VVDDYLESPRGQDATRKVGDFVARIYAAQIEDEFGLRCPDFEPGCPTCEAWAAFDKWERGE